LSAYIPALADTPEVGSVTLSEPGGANVAAARKALGHRLGGVYDSPAELFRKEKPDLALVAMEAKLAPPVIHAALDAGCHIMAEKPACVRLAEFEALAAKAKASNRHLMLALGNRVDPYVIEMLRIVQGGHIGKVFGVELHIVADQTRLTRPAYHKTWVAQKARAGGGHLIWLGIHWLDLAMFLTKSKIKEVAGFTANVGGQPIDTEDSAVVAMRFDNGTLGTITSGYYLDKSYHSMLKVWGSHGWAEMRKHTGQGLEWYSTKEATPVVHRVNKDDQPTGYTPFIQSVVRSVAGLQPPPLTTADSLEALKVVFAAYRAAETGRSVVI
jgi:predicted dehydrogenase